jgi:flagellar biosynthesis protein FlhF
MTATIRTFRANNAAAALEAVKEALGPNAVILSTREVRGGLLRTPQIEVTAGLSNDEDAPSVAKAPAAPKVEVPVIAPALSKTPYAAASQKTVAPFSDEISSLKSALDEMRQQLLDVADSHKARSAPATWDRPLLAEAVEHLEAMGVESQLAKLLVDEVDQATLGASRPALWEGLRKLLAQKLVPARAPWRPDRRRIIALVGPTGVGKTTTLAKIAARALMESNIGVSLVTVDTYRIGASEQIARYGEIMKVPTYVAKDRAELLMAVGKSPQAQLILIDTAGRSLNEAVARQAELIRSIPGVELHLVMSAATGARQMAAVADRYKALNPDRVIFTKLDEAEGAGSIVSAASRLNCPVSCVTDGQRVPEDLHSLTGTEMADLVLGNAPEVSFATAR